jgi:HSP20 family protein
MKNLVKYNSLAPKGMSQYFDEFFNRNLTDFFGSDFSMQSPSINIVESDNDFRVEVAAPGLEKENFEINVEKGMLNISAKRVVNEEAKEDKYVRREFNYTSFNRSFQLPESVDSEKIEASYKSGVLALTLPKMETAKAKPVKVIEIS